MAEDGPTLYKQLCASCHDTGLGRAPTRDVLRQMTPERVLAALESGAMLSMASGRTGVERRAIAEFVTGKPFAEAFSTRPSPQAMCRAAAGEFANPLAGPAWNGWGVNTRNTRYQDAAAAGLTAADVPQAEGEMGVRLSGRAERRCPAGDRRRSRVRRHAERHRLRAERRHRLRPLDVPGRRRGARRGDHRPHRAGRPRARGRVRRRPIAATSTRSTPPPARRLWKVHVDDHPFARVTASPTVHEGRVYVGVASGEETAGAVADYQCCTFRGSLVALNAATGTQVWKTYTIEPPKPTSKNKVGTQLWGPSGAPIWSSPAIDTQRNAVYVTTGNNYSGPASDKSDAFVAFDLASGKILWSRQMTAADDWNTSCRLPDQINCTNTAAPDHDFASPPMLVSLPNGRRALVAGQKSGMVHALDPDRDGQILWQQRAGKGGINGGVQWGSAADATHVYVALSDLGRIPVPNSQATLPDPEAGGGMFAFRLDTGQQAWHTEAPRACRTRDRCSPAQSAAVSAIPGVTFSGAIDGHFRAYSTRDGSILWDVDTAQTYQTTNGVPARGGSLNVAGPAVAGGTVIVNSGYVQNGMPGNVLLAFTVDGK